MMKFVIALAVLTCVAQTHAEVFANGAIFIFDSNARNQKPILNWIARTTEKCSSRNQRRQLVEKFSVAGSCYLVVHDLDNTTLSRLTSQATSLGGIVVPNYMSINTGFSPLDTLPTVQPDTPAVCTPQSCNCWSRPIGAEQLQLDLLDGVSGDSTFCGPRKCDEKIDVFILSTGLDPTHTEFDQTTTDDCKPSCYPLNTTWTPREDVFGLGTYVAGLVGSKSYGITQNVILHSIKVLHDNFQGPLSAVICALEKVENWLQTHPSKSALILFDTQFDFTQTIPLVSSMLKTYENRVIGLTFALNCQYPASENDIVTVGSVDSSLNLVVGNPSCVKVLAAAYGIRSTIPHQSSVILNATPGFAVVASLLAEYKTRKHAATAIEIRRLLLSPDDNELSVNKQYTCASVPDTKKLITYSCPDGCTPCASPRACTSCCNGNAQCLCPLHTADTRGICTPVPCPRGVRSIGHPDFCDVAVNCIEGHGRRCGRRNGQQQFFDTVLSRCVVEADALAVRNCSPLPRC